MKLPVALLSGLLLALLTACGAKPAAVAEGSVEGIPDNVKALLAERRSAVQSKPSAATWGAYGELLGALNMDSAALQALQQAMQADPSNPRWPYYAGVITVDTDFQRSSQWLETTLQLKPDYAPAWIHLSATRRGMSKLDESAAALQKALALAPGDAKVLLLAARLAAIRERLPEAREFAEQAVKAGNAADTCVELARIARLQGDSRRSAEAMKMAESRALKITPELVDPWVKEMMDAGRPAPGPMEQAGALAVDGKLEEAVAAYQKILSAEPKNGKAMMYLGSVLLRLGRIPEGAAQLNQAVKLEGATAETWILLGTARQRDVDYTGAVEAYRKAVEVKPDSFEAHYTLGLALKDLTRYDEAAEAFRQSVALKPDNKEAALALGLSLMQAGKHQDAAKVFAAIDPNNLQARVLGAVALMEAKQFAEADVQIREAEKLKPMHPMVKRVRADWMRLSK